MFKGLRRGKSKNKTDRGSHRYQEPKATGGIISATSYDSGSAVTSECSYHERTGSSSSSYDSGSSYSSSDSGGGDCGGGGSF